MEFVGIIVAVSNLEEKAVTKYAKMCRKMCQNEKSPFKGDLEGLTFVSFVSFVT